MPLPAPDFERLLAPGTRHTIPGVGDFTVRLRTDAWLSLPSGRVVAGEPFMYGGEDSDGFVQRVPPGRYPVVLALADFANDETGETGDAAYTHCSVAAARLVIRDEPVVSWEMAVYEGQDVDRLGPDEFYGYPVDGGTGGFTDVQHIATFSADYDDYADRIMVALGAQEDDYTAPVTLTGPDSEPMVVAFPSGDGDGHYPTWVGRTADGEVACMLTDFFLLPDGEPGGGTGESAGTTDPDGRSGGETDQDSGGEPEEARGEIGDFAQGHEMLPGQSLRRQSLTSASGRYTLVHQDDGNLVLYDNAQLRPLWAAGTNGSRAALCTLGANSGLVLADHDGARVWSSGTAGGPAARLLVRDDGDVVLESSDGRVVWSTGTAEATVPDGPVAIGDRMLPGQTLGRQSLTSPSGRNTLVHQHDGNLVLYDNTGRGGVWSSGTQGRGTARCVLHQNGDLALYDRTGQVVWSTDTAGHPGSRLIVDDDGVFLRAPDGTTLWSVHTSGGPRPRSDRG
jgi:Protein of unknown function (DUF4241)